MTTATHSWPWTPLGEVLVERKEAPSAAELATGAIRVIAKIGFNDGKIQLRPDAKTRTGMILVRPGDLVVSGINAAKGAIAVYDGQDTEPLAATIHYGSYIPKRDRVDLRYLWWLLRSQAFRDILDTSLPGGIKTELKAKRLLPIRIPLPPLDEQRRIVARIEELTAKAEAAQRLRGDSIREVSSLIGAARHSVVEVLRMKHGDVRLGDICTKITDGPHVSPVYVSQGIPFISVRNISENGIDFSNAKYVSREHHRVLSRKARVEPGDVLYTKGGTTGVARRVDTDREFSIWVHVALLKLKPTEATAGFVEHMLNAPTSKTQAREFTHGSSNKDLGLTRLCNIVFPLPPLGAQHRIVAQLDALHAKVGSLKKLQAESTAELDALMPSILAKVFRGEL